MATTFTKLIQPQDGNWIVTFGIGSKDPADVALAQQYGDLNLDFSGSYVDPADPTFSFSIPKDDEALWSNILLNKLPNITYNYAFDDASVLSATRYRMAVIFANAILNVVSTTTSGKLYAALTALRAMPSTPPVNTTVTV